MEKLLFMKLGIFEMVSLQFNDGFGLKRVTFRLINRFAKPIYPWSRIKAHKI